MIEPIGFPRTPEGLPARRDDRDSITAVWIPGPRVGYQVGGARGRIYADPSHAIQYAERQRRRIK